MRLVLSVIKTSAKGGAHACCVDMSIILRVCGTSIQCV